MKRTQVLDKFILTARAAAIIRFPLIVNHVSKAISFDLAALKKQFFHFVSAALYPRFGARNGYTQSIRQFFLGEMFEFGLLNRLFVFIL